jgi:hypothetical protein
LPADDGTVNFNECATAEVDPMMMGPPSDASRLLVEWSTGKGPISEAMRPLAVVFRCHTKPRKLQDTLPRNSVLLVGATEAYVCGEPYLSVSLANIVAA